MKPIRLEMKAFGTFLDETIDFEELNKNGLYLISGPTGSGKTTIFDAIVFALYGEASGNVRISDEFRSDFALGTEETIVNFTFLIGNVEYMITRSPKYMVPGRKTAHYSKAYLYKGNVLLCDGVKDVNDEVSKLLGLTVDQFRQVIMLAQGEFMKLLHAQSKDRDEIFRKIFGTERINMLSLKLKEEYQEKKNELANLDSLLKEQVITLNHFITLENSTNALNDIYFCEDLNKELTIYINNENDSLILKKNEFKNFETELKDNLSKKAKIEGFKETKKEYEEKEKAYNKLLEEESFYNDLEEKRMLLSHINSVKPSYDEYQNIYTHLQNVKTKQEKNNQDKELNDNEYSFYEEQAEAIKVDEELLKKDEDNALLLKDEIKIYKFIEEKQKDLKQTEGLVNKQSLLISSLNTSLESINAKYKLNAEAYKDLDNINDSIKNKELLKQEIVNNQRVLFNISKSLTVLNDNQKALDLLKLKYLALKDQENLLISEKKELENIYISSLAFSLREELKEGKPCPVCGSTNHPIIGKAVKCDKIVKKEDIDKKDQEIRKVQEETSIIRSNTDIANSKVGDSVTVLSDYFGNKDDYNKAFTEKKNEIEKEYNDINNDINKLKTLKDNAEKCKKENLILDEEIKKVENSIHSALVEKTRLDTLQNSITNIIEENKNKLSDPSCTLDDYEDALTNLEDNISERKAALEGFYAGLQEVKEEKARISGLEKSFNDEYKDYSEKLSKAQNIYNNALKENAISENDYLNNVSSLKDLNTITIEITKYKENVLNTKKQFDELKEKVDKIPLYNEEEIINKVKELESKKDILDASIHEIEARLSTISIVKDKFDESIPVRNKLFKEVTYMKDLSDVANGTNALRLSFERYILAEYFNDILRHANTRLSNFTNGRFRLHRKEEKSKGSQQQGLDMEIFDAETGKYRDVKTMSGGESFKAALSLAMGLADCIEEHSGAVEINCLFIDEGFGTLDDESLNQAIEILEQIMSTNKVVGIISHVQTLKDLIPYQIIVEKAPKGSKTKVKYI